MCQSGGIEVIFGKNLASLKNDIFSIQNVNQVPEYVH
jgi:hypothetical protein